MTDDTPTCEQCGTALEDTQGTPVEWYCPGSCDRDQILWRTSTGGKLHTNIKCERLRDASRGDTQRDAEYYDESEYCRYCLDRVNHTNQAEYATLAKRMRASDDPEEVKREFFGGEAQP